LYRAVDSTGQTIDFLLTAKRDADSAKRFCGKVFSAEGNLMARVLNMDKNPSYAAVRQLKTAGTLSRSVRLRQCRYLNKIVEPDHRVVKKRAWVGKGYGSFQSVWRTLQGTEAMNMIRKGRVRGLVKGEVVGQALFIGELFDLAV
jgi:IS6 family transposase